VTLVEGISVTNNESSIAGGVLSRLESAWNAADGEAFGKPFAEDADFVDIRGEHHRGRGAIAGGHQALFDSVYKGSRIRYAVMQARSLVGGLLLVHGSATLNVPSGPLAGESRSTVSLVLLPAGNDKQIASFHNTLVQA
jgi:uncharacterized protein (TIGR02246 family)